jgi:flagellar biosynthetic protein FliS
MLAQRDPQQAYRRVDFDARVSSADPRELVAVCYEQLSSALGGALLANERHDPRMKSQALTRAVAALTALQMGVSGENAVADALNHLYTTARRTVLDSVLNFDGTTIARIRQDFRDIAAGMSEG